MFLAAAACTPTELRRPAPAPAASAGEPPQLRGMQYLYGSGEAAAIGRQAWNGLVAFVAETRRTLYRCAGCFPSAILDPQASLAHPSFRRCGPGPQAVVLDVDETVLLNLGAEATISRAARTASMRRAGIVSRRPAARAWPPHRAPARRSPSCARWA